MIKLPTPAVPDLARAEGETVDELTQWFIAFFDAKRVPWNYVRGTRIIKDAHRGLHSLHVLLSGCLLEKNATSRKANADIVQMAAPLCFGRNIQVFDLPAKKFEFGQDLKAGYRIPFFFTESGKIKLYYLQPRSQYSLSIDQLGMIATIHKMFILDVDFSGDEVDVEYVDLSSPREKTKRETKTYCLEDLNLWSEERLEHRLSLIAEALRHIAVNDLVAARPIRPRQTPDMPLFD